MKQTEILIVVSSGRFNNVEIAARSETKVRWFEPNSAADAVTECFAAMELRAGLKALFKMAGKNPPAIRFAHPSAVNGKSDIRIIIGTPETNPAAAGAGLQNEIRRLRHDGCVIASVRGQTKTVCLSGRTRQGVLNGVYRYLEELGLNWTSPEQPSAARRAGLELWRPNMRIVESPDFALRGAYYTENTRRVGDDLLLWLARNRFNFVSAGRSGAAFAKKIGLNLTAGGHVFHEIMDPDREIRKGVKLFDAHPDWFHSDYYGKRQRVKGALCMSSPEGRKYLIKSAVEIIRKAAAGIDFYRFWPYDCWGMGCKCSQCRKSGNDADRYLRLVHELRTALDEAFTKGVIDHRIKLLFICYEGSGIVAPPSLSLPEGFDRDLNWLEVWPINRCYAHAQSDPSCRELNLHYWRGLQGWLRLFPDRTIMSEYYNVSQFADMATVFSKVMAADAAVYKKAGIAGIQFMHLAENHWGPRALTNWQLGRLAWQAGRPLEKTLKPFFESRFGPFASKAAPLYSKLDRAMSNLAVIKSWLPGSLRGRFLHIYAETMGDRSTENIFVYDHLFLHRPKHSDGTIGFGLNNLDDIMSALRAVHAGLVRLSRMPGLSPVVRVNLLEDIGQVAYTLDFLGLYDEFARYWEANRYGRKSPAPHRKRILELAKKIDGAQAPGSALYETRCIIAKACLIGAVRKEFGVNYDRNLDSARRRLY